MSVSRHSARPSSLPCEQSRLYTAAYSAACAAAALRRLATADELGSAAMGARDAQTRRRSGIRERPPPLRAGREGDAPDGKEVEKYGDYFFTHSAGEKK
eukprot:scaffold181863_cov31-Tisochrysis_lutea.AAC.2